MARIVRCLIVALLTGSIAKSAPPTVTPSPSHPPHIRFLSLAEARAIALENGEIAGIRVLARPGKKGILLTGVSDNPKQDEYKININQTLLNVETAYWNLYGSYWQLHSREQAMRFAYETLKIVSAKYQVGRAGLADCAQAEGQYNLFRSQRVQALDTMLDNERQLRAILRLPAGKNVRLAPSDAPTLREKKLHWKKALAKALKTRSELKLAREGLKLAEANVQEVEKTETSHPIRPVAWEDGPSRLHNAELQLERARLRVRDQELKTERFLGLEYRRLSSSYFQIKAARAQREAFATQLRLRREQFRTGAKDASLDLLLEAQRFWADALATEYQSIVTYNNAICAWNYVKENILSYARVRLVEEAPADHKTVRAVVLERKRTRRQIQRTPALPTDSPLSVPDDCDLSKAPSVPALWKSFPSLREEESLKRD